MSEAVPQEKATIQEAAGLCQVDRKTIYRWINKGLISKQKKGNKTFVLLEEVRALCGIGTPQDATKFVAESGKSHNLVTVERPHYEGLLVRLGQLESEKRYLLEYKAGLEEKDRELSEAKFAITDQQAEIIRKERELSEAEQLLKEKNRAMEQAEKKIQELQAEVERFRRLPWWKRLFLK